MTRHRLTRSDLLRAQAMIRRLLAPDCPAAQLRRRVERMLAKADPDSQRYAFWRLLLALIVAHSAQQKIPDAAFATAAPRSPG